MLPDLKILICGVALGPLLFAVTGVGVLSPGSHTRVGEIPEIGRPMMQRVITDEPAQAQFHAQNVARRSEELERLRERAALEVAAAIAQPDPDLPKDAVIENTDSGDVAGVGATAPAQQRSDILEQRSDTLEIESETASGSVQTRPAKLDTEEAPDDPDPVQVAMLAPTSEDAERAPGLLRVPLPPLRPAAGTGIIHRRVPRRQQRVVQAPPPPDTLGQLLFARPLLMPR